jgi:hypothetical protein
MLRFFIGLRSRLRDFALLNLLLDTKACLSILSACRPSPKHDRLRESLEKHNDIYFWDTTLEHLEGEE